MQNKEINEQNKHFTHLTYKDRVRIEELLKHNVSFSKIARELGRSKSTIVDEINRNSRYQDKHLSTKLKAKGYDADGAEYFAHQRWYAKSTQRLKLSHHWQKVINEYLANGYSLMQISQGTRVPYSVNSLYNYAKHNLINFTHKKYRIKRKYDVRSTQSDSKFFIKRSIETRSERVNQRLEFGHWEADGVESPQGIKPLVITFVERQTRFMVAIKAHSKSGHDVAEVTRMFLRRYARYVKSITYDRGNEFANAENMLILESIYKLKVYFATPYASYERGSNEERNRQFRKYFPKGTKFNHVTQEQINRATMLINDKPMGKLGWHSPEHKFTVHQVQIDRKVNNKHTTTKKD
ncbi:IS30 family transposase [Leuconostoc pseudomesenteroides]|uniref:IS30 family transposase n=1 Tax=Leuconostoc pseudomesenteroides TaxID=33968 RepID=A0A5B8T1W4_LEUPS|nr:IS30 family transposase [Leuconostoc pseudomesenteroides]MCT4380344.1 IS30 family transposase [Leuconostoc pseudomesenteroides]QEA42344.1 IS30 family transposase [Leuconostoc pseudomesenteroides]